MPSKGLQSYHLVWLSVHPERSEEWLRGRLKDGFHIHHIDGDHSNDAPDNLVLIDGTDHLRLHGMHLKNGLRAGKKRAKPKKYRPRKRPNKLSPRRPSLKERRAAEREHAARRALDELEARLPVSESTKVPPVVSSVEIEREVANAAGRGLEGLDCARAVIEVVGEGAGWSRVAAAVRRVRKAA